MTTSDRISTILDPKPVGQAESNESTMDDRFHRTDEKSLTSPGMPGGGVALETDCGPVDDDWTIRDTRLATKAIRQGWDVPAEQRPRLIRNLTAVLHDASRSNRERQSAREALLYAAAWNDAADRAEILANSPAKPITPTVATSPRRRLPKGVAKRRRL